MAGKNKIHDHQAPCRTNHTITTPAAIAANPQVRSTFSGAFITSAASRLAALGNPQ
jgi:hypothetical protein